MYESVCVCVFVVTVKKFGDFCVYVSLCVMKRIYTYICMCVCVCVCMYV